MNHAHKAIAHEIKIRRVAYFYSAAEHRSRGALWPSFAPALILERERAELEKQIIGQEPGMGKKTGKEDSTAPESRV